MEDSGNGTGNGELNGPQTYMKVAVNPGMVTKATAGEEGEGEDQSEEGNKDEYAVKDITVILFRDAGESYTTAPSEFKADSKLVAAGFGIIPGNTDPNDESWHKRMATVTLDVMQDKEDFDRKKYGIIAVANLGDTDGNVLKGKIGTEVTTGAELANLLQAEYKGSGFIMSTHNDKYGTSNKIFDNVTLEAGVNPNSAPEAVVHVERLAAKVRISEAAADQADNFIYTIKEGEGTGTEVAKVRLDEVAIVNQLNSGSFLLKRVTADVSGTDKTIPGKTGEHDNYLGNENANTANPAFAINYVIDPWTRNKTVAKSMVWSPLAINSETLAESKTLSYINHFVGDNYAAMWTDFTSKPVALANSDKFTNAENEELDLVYTMENTTSAAMSKNGFSTGALFKATYIPKRLSTVKVKSGTTGKITKEVVADVVTNYNPDGSETLAYDAIEKDSKVTLDFYLYGNNAYDSYAAIFNEYVWGEQKSLDNQQDVTIYSYENFTSDNIVKIKKKAFFEHVLGTTSDPLGYIASLRKAVAGEDGELSADEIIALGETVFAEADGIDNYIERNDGNTATLNKNINKFEDCVCYYPYWIRHADNESIDMGVMEFGIVRNNIYDMKVTGISGYGYSGIEKPEPGTDDELKKFFFNVEINVKNWVVRSNDDIIL